MAEFKSRTPAPEYELSEVGPNMTGATMGSTSNPYVNPYVDPTTNTERLPYRPAPRGKLEKAYRRWCCGSIIGLILWILGAVCLITVPIVVVVLRNVNVG